MKLFAVGLACCWAALCEAKKVAPWRCPLQNCALKSNLATAGPGFMDGLQFFQVDRDGKDRRLTCPFGGDDGKEASKKEWLKYMHDLDDVAKMTREEKIALGKKLEENYANEPMQDKEVKEPSLDVTKPGVEEVNAKTWGELRNANKFDFLITFYAPWCPHCKSFVMGKDAPLKALSESLEKAGGPNVVTFDITASDVPLSVNSVPTTYLFTRDGLAILYEGDAHNSEALMAFALQEKAATKLLLAQGAVAHPVQTAVRPWACPVENCVLKSQLAVAGPGLLDGVRFFAAGNKQTCPFGDDNDPEPSKEEYMKYMKGLSKVGNMSPEERRAYAIANADRWTSEARGRATEAEAAAAKEPRVDITKAGAEPLNSTTWNELRNANKFDMLVTFYAPWCPHCKAFVLGENAPVKALSAGLEKAKGPKVVTFDIQADDPPLMLEAVPTIFLFKTSGSALEYQGDPGDIKGLMAWVLEHQTPEKKGSFVNVRQHLRKALP